VIFNVIMLEKFEDTKGLIRRYQTSNQKIPKV
jgi:hypothetical protein